VVAAVSVGRCQVRDVAARASGVFIARENRRKTMEFLLSHWHCIVPILVIAVVALLHRGKKKK
jgi:hypothetical protein